MSWLSDLPSWVSAGAAVVSSITAVVTYKVSQNLLNLQKSIENERKPLVHIWCNDKRKLTIINISKEPLAIRGMRILNGLRSNDQRSVAFKLHRVDYVEGVSKQVSKTTDLIFSPNQTFLVEISEELGQLTVESLNYDGSFEFIEIDTSKLGGEYILKGMK